MPNPFEQFKQTTEAPEATGGNPFAAFSAKVEKPLPEMRAEKGFIAKLQNPVDAIKEHGILANAAKWYMTPQAVFDKRSKDLRKDTIQSVPALADLSKVLDDYEQLAGTGNLTSEQEEEYYRLQDSYGDLYQRVAQAYDDGELEQGLSWDSFKAAWEEDAGGVMGEFVNGLIGTPELMMTPAGWTMAAGKSAAAAKAVGASQRAVKGSEIVGGMAGASALGATLTGSQNVSEQLAKTGKVNADEAILATEIGAVLSPVIVGAARGVISVGKGVGKSITQARVERYTKDATSKATDYVTRGLDPDVAIERAIDETVTSPKLREVLAAQHDYISEQLPKDRKPSVEVATEVSANNNAWSNFIGGVGKRLDYLISPIATQLSLINKSLGFSIQRYDMDLGLRIKAGLDVKEALRIDVFKGLSKIVGKKLHYYLVNQNRKAALKLVEDNPKMKETMGRVFKYLDDVIDEAQALGMKLGKLSDFFPRHVKDYAKYMRAKGYKITELQEYMARELDRKFKITNAAHRVSKSDSVDELRKFFTPEEFDVVLNKFLSTRKGEVTARSTATSMKPRVIEHVSEKDLASHYDDPIKTLTDYINTVSMKIQTRKFFGGKAADSPTNFRQPKRGAISMEEDMIEQSIGKLTRELSDSGQILPDDIGDVAALLHARFVGGSKSPNNLWGGVRDVIYSALLGNPIAAATQLGDTGASVYINGILPTLKTLVREVTDRKQLLKMDDVGLNNLVEELEHLRPTAKLLEKALKFGMFKKVDEIGKVTVMNAALDKARTMIKTKKGRAKLHNKYKDAFTPEEMTQLMQDLRIGRKSPNVKFLAWHELTRVQPISLSEMPAAYLNNPNGRIFYMLKSFTLKQIDLIRRESIQKIKEGHVAEGVGNLLRHVAVLGLANGSVEQGKAWLRGDEQPFDDIVIANMFRNYGLSSYLGEKVISGRPMAALAGLISPPLQVIDDVISSAIDGNFMKMSKNIPLVAIAAKPISMWFENDE